MRVFLAVEESEGHHPKKAELQEWIVHSDLAV
jgi:hypothetical protein